MKLHPFRFYLFALYFIGAWFPRWGIAEQGETQTVKRSLSVTEAYACSLNVWNQETQSGKQDRKLTEFRLILRANYQGSSPNERAPRGRFRVKQLELKYFKNWGDAKSNLTAEEISDSIDWSKVKVRAEGPRSEELPLLEFPSSAELSQVNVHSTLPMARNDLMRLGQFEFVPEQAGVYELHFQVLRKNAVAYEMRELVEFHCPQERPQLTVLNAGILHQMRIPFIQIPLVASTFFESGGAVLNQNPTDRIFRSVFWGLTAKRLSRNALEAKLLLLEDPTSALDAAAQSELAQQRAKTLVRLFEKKAEEFRGGAQCAPKQEASNEPVVTNGHAPLDSCAPEIKIERAWPGQSQVFIKSSGSEVSPEWFAQENRVVPLVATLAAQRTLFQPLKLKPLEESDDIELRCEPGLSASLLGCVRGAFLEVTNSRGESRRQKISLEDLQAGEQSERRLRLNSAAMREFLNEGEFSARLLLQTGSSDSLRVSPATAFKIHRRNIVRDEVFALSPYDRADLIYALDHERIAALSQEILLTLRDSLNTARASEIFVLITGHSDSLGEHRPQSGVGRTYNLSLSFSRAVYLRRLLGDSLRARAAQMGLALHARGELLHIPTTLRESVSKNVNNPTILEVFNRPNCNGTEPECTEEKVRSYLEQLITEKVRHFKAGLTQETSRSAEVPTVAEVRAHIAALHALLPLEIATFEMPGPRYVHLISTGLGAAVPFYRRLEVSEELQEVFCRAGFTPEEMPRFFFGKDAHPAGRVMNRRVELNVIW